MTSPATPTADHPGEPRRHRWPRVVGSRAAAWPLAVAVLAGASVVGASLVGAPGSAGASAPFAPAVQGAALREQAAPRSTSSGPIALRVDPATDLDPSGSSAGTITVAGSGFNAGQPLLVAVCAVGSGPGAAPASLDACLGGPVPAKNTSKGWAYVSADGKPGPATDQQGGVPAAFGPGGGFTVKLTLPAATAAADCPAKGCAVFTRTVQGGNDGALSVPITFAGAAPTTPPTTAPTTPPTTAPPTTAPATKTTPTTTDNPTTATTPSSAPPPISISTQPQPSTLQPRTVRAKTIAVGGSQQISFLGFRPGEKVTVQLFSDPISLPSRTVDQDGFVVIDFTVPLTLPPGTHVLQVTGSQSRNIGIARFVVTAAPTSPSPTPSPTPSSAPSSAPVSSPPVSSAVFVPPTVASSGASSAASVAPPVITAPTTASSRPIWPWFVLGGIVLLLIAAGVFLWVRPSRQLAEENDERERRLADAAMAEHQRAVAALQETNAQAPTVVVDRYDDPSAGPAYPTYYGDDPGLLSGRDHPDSPPLLSGQGPGPDDRTAYFPPVQQGQGSATDDATQAMPPPFRLGPEPGRPPTAPRHGLADAPDDDSADAPDHDSADAPDDDSGTPEDPRAR